MINRLARIKLWIQKHRTIREGDTVRVLSKSVGIDRLAPIGREFQVHSIIRVGTTFHRTLQEFQGIKKHNPLKEDVYELLIGRNVLTGELRTSYFLRQDLAKR